MRSTIANNGVYNPLTSRLGKTEAEMREAEQAFRLAEREQAAKNLLVQSTDPADFLMLADMLGLLDVVPEDVLTELRDLAS
jgi:hypothetical protein